MPASLFITGSPRCGSTLLEKLLCNHPRLSVLSQPLPLLFVEAKRAFLDARGLSGDPYPLGTLFRERRYHAADFASYLDDWAISRNELLELAARMETYSGQYTRFPSHRWADSWASSCNGFATNLEAWLRALGHRRVADYWGAKESFCEEYVPHLLQRGFACILVLRDPRAVVTSLAHGDFRRHAGRLKPTLFNVRLWRKSIAYALHCQAQPNCLVLRYEDLVADPQQTLDRVARWLGIAPFTEEWWAPGPRDQEGQAWPGNSSFGPHQGVSAHDWRSVLPAEVSRFVSASCWPEMECLGYAPDLAAEEVPATLLGFRDPYALEREELRAYAEDPGELRAELERWRLANAGEEDEGAYFVFPDVLRRLQAAMLGAGS